VGELRQTPEVQGTFCIGRESHTYGSCWYAGDDFERLDIVRDNASCAHYRSVSYTHAAENRCVPSDPYVDTDVDLVAWFPGTVTHPGRQIDRCTDLIERVVATTGDLHRHPN
jgi:hypothetical protein